MSLGVQENTKRQTKPTEIGLVEHNLNNIMKIAGLRLHPKFFYNFFVTSFSFLHQYLVLLCLLPFRNGR